MITQFFNFSNVVDKFMELPFKSLKILLFMKNINIKLLDQLSIYQKLFYQIKWSFYWSKTSLTPYIYETSRTLDKPE